MTQHTTFGKHSISAAAASAMISAATAKALELGLGISVTIVDESGVLKAFARTDDAPLMSIGASQRKATTAVGLGMPTGQPWHDFIKDDPILRQGVQGIPDFILLGGGLPIRAGGALVGAIGVSGGHYLQDEECAKAALAAIG